MRPKQSLLFLLVGLLVLAGGWYLGRETPGSTRVAVAPGALVFPDIAPALQNAARIEITSKGKTITLQRKPDGAWGLAERGGYVVQAARLREMLTGLTELRIAEERTSDPGQFARLGLDDPSRPDSTANLLRVLDAAGKPLVELVTGHRRVRTQGGGPGGGPESIYIRRPGENRTWLAEGRLAVDADPSLWLEREIMNIPLTRIAHVSVRRGAEWLALSRTADGARLQLTAPAGVTDLDPFKLEETGRGLESFTFQEVREAKDVPGTRIGTGTYKTTDGLTVEVTLFKDGELLWATFAVSGDGDAGTEADDLARRLHGWAYQIGNWKEKAITPELADLRVPPQPQVAPMPNPAATTAPAGGTASPPASPPAGTAPAEGRAPDTGTAQPR